MRVIQSWLVSTAIALAPIAVWADVPTRSGLSIYIARMVGTALPFKEEHRWDSYLTISRLAEVLRHESRFGKEIATLTTDTFPGFPLLVLTDRDGDQRADFFAYHDLKREKNTLEFGVFFSVSEDLKPAWIVFNSGVIFEVAEDDQIVFFWGTHQFVDRNGDGRFDLYITNGEDSDGDGNLKQHDTEWVFDDDDDGLFDRAESIVDGQVHEMKPIDGVFHLAALLDAITADILEALGGAKP